jgi:hypothetical protein
MEACDVGLRNDEEMRSDTPQHHHSPSFIRIHPSCTCVDLRERWGVQHHPNTRKKENTLDRISAPTNP